MGKMGAMIFLLVTGELWSAKQRSNRKRSDEDATPIQKYFTILTAKSLQLIGCLMLTKSFEVEF